MLPVCKPAKQIPSEKVSTLKGKNNAPIGNNCFCLFVVVVVVVLFFVFFFFFLFFFCILFILFFYLFIFFLILFYKRPYFRKGSKTI